ncbi:unnamed protein product [Caenorhabditis auriculariae]|uniref:Uncharacterized protein n=1 Tax=Caenorhabditis auriculariae TaxID=2777116 RepID=A0A8S1GQU6_9PELO|nr:unnamed protein product [Caenorhabditis auriculariae]
MNSASSAQSPVRTAPQSFDSLANAPLRIEIRRPLDITTRTRRSLDFNALSPVRPAPASQEFDSLANAPFRENIRRSLDTTTRTRRSLDFSLDLARPNPVEPVPEVPAGILKTPTRSKISPKASKRVTWAPIRKTRQNGKIRHSSVSAQPSALSLANWNPNSMKSLVVTLLEMPSRWEDDKAVDQVIHTKVLVTNGQLTPSSVGKYPTKRLTHLDPGQRQFRLISDKELEPTFVAETLFLTMNSASSAQSPVRTAPQSFDSLANAPLRKSFRRSLDTTTKTANRRNLDFFALSPVRPASSSQEIDNMANAPLRENIRRPLDITTRTRRSLDFNALSPVRHAPALEDFNNLANAPLRKTIRRSLDTTTKVATRRSLNFNVLSPVRASPASQEIDSLANAPLRKNIRRSLDTTTRTRRSLNFFALSPVRAAPVPQNFDSLENAPLRRNMRRSLDTTTKTRRSLNFLMDLAPAQRMSETLAEVSKTPTRSEMAPEVVQRLSWAPNRQTRRSLDSAQPPVLVFALENSSRNA